MDRDTQLSLLWLAEMTLPLYEHTELARVVVAPCAKCRHDRSHHAVGGDADNPSPWPCTFPQSLGAPARLCTCPDYEPLEFE